MCANSSECPLKSQTPRRPRGADVGLEVEVIVDQKLIRARALGLRVRVFLRKRPLFTGFRGFLRRVAGDVHVAVHDASRKALGLLVLVRHGCYQYMERGLLSGSISRSPREFGPTKSSW